MSGLEIKQNIQLALKSFQDYNLTEKSLNLFRILGYNTKRQAPLDKKTYKGFKDAYLDGNTRFNEDKAVVSEWKYIDLLFQLSKDEITTQIGIFDTKQVDRTIIETYLFFVIELSKESYSRSALSQITREVNKVFPMPVLVLFKHGKSLTLAVINRRLHKKDEQKDVLEKVTLIKDINIENPHRAHIEILFDLSLEELQRVHKFTNFVELHYAWQKTLDTKELNKKFYKELSNWYFWAMREVDFPSEELHKDKKSLFKEEDKEKEHNAKNLIRLLTRLLFVWFVKEKGLIPEELFDEKYVANELLLNFRPKKGTGASGNITSCYYRAILQNLFFATLNQNMGKREFRKSGQHINVTNLMRYERYFKDSKKFIQLVEKVVPFMNGGLFECLDRPDFEKMGKQGGDVIIYLDGFSDREDNHLTVPDYIFFGTENHVDLSEAYGDKANEYKNAAVKGLINILKSYKFTVAENTPLEEEIALDPELLGQVFENLLASYNPETKTTARKQTGSFYTPREIVNYMVDESLIAYLKQKLDEVGIKDKEANLRDLISYSENKNCFNSKETQQLISAIDNCKIIDPACGSGAFPMGVLHKLAHVLHKLDPQNALWKQRQITKAEAIDDSTVREQTIFDIEEAFENNELDYGRKLYLIENCIYGVDIQPIATQISKLRFFISLIVDQKVNAKKDNFGIRPLPNLETKFVAANTLIGIEKPKEQITFGSSEIEVLEESLKDVRHRLFNAKTSTTKRKLREEDKVLREQMGNLLIKNGWANETAHQLAGWDPYDQNASSPFFDSEWMFGFTNGFDIAIGNPPYGYLFKEKALFELMNNSYETAEYKIDAYTLFVEKGKILLNKSGHGCFITPYTFLSGIYFSKFRNFLYKCNLKILIVLGKKVFHAADVDTCIFIFNISEAKGEVSIADFRASESIEHIKEFTTFLVSKSLLFSNYSAGILVADEISINTYFKILNKAKLLEDFVVFYHGIQSRGDEKAITTNRNKDSYPLLKGRDFNRYKLEPEEKYFTFKSENIKSGGNLDFHLTNKKIIIRTTADKIVATIDYEKYLVLNSVNIAISKSEKYSLEFLLGILNSKLIEFWYKLTVQESGKTFAEVKIVYLERIPIILPLPEYQRILSNLVLILLNTNKLISNNSCSLFFESLINAIIYELYLEDEIKSAGCDNVLKYLINIPVIQDNWNDTKKIVNIEKVYKELSQSKHPASIAMVKMQEVPEVRIIEGRDN